MTADFERPSAMMILADMRVEPSDDGQYLLIYCRRRCEAGTCKGGVCT